MGLIHKNKKNNHWIFRVQSFSIQDEAEFIKKLQCVMILFLRLTISVSLRVLGNLNRVLTKAIKFY